MEDVKSTKISFNTLEDIEKAFPDEAFARRYIANIRWGQWAKCPYCGNEKSYFIENGTRYKCASKECYKKFSVTVNTLMEATNVPLHNWLKLIFVYCKKRGRCEFSELKEVASIKQDKTVISIGKKIGFAFSSIEREVGEPTEDLMRKLIYSLIFSYDLYEDDKNKDTYNTKFHAHVGVINDISDIKQYNELLTYTKWYMKTYATWIFIDFTTPNDVLSETFLALKDKGVIEYNTELVLRILRNTYAKMWEDYLANSKGYRGHIKRMQTESKKRRMEQLTYSEMVNKIDKIYKIGGALKTKEFLKDKPYFLEREREVLLIRRKIKKIFRYFNYNEIMEFSKKVDEWAGIK